MSETATHPTDGERGYATTIAAQPLGAFADIVHIEADITRGLHSFSIIGLPDRAVAEARDRICAAIRHSGYKSPKQQNARIVLSLSPANLKKEGGQYDLALAIAYLCAAEKLPLSANALFIGELALDGTLRPVRGVLAQVIAAQKNGVRHAFVPKENEREAALVNGVCICGVKSLAEVIEKLTQPENMACASVTIPKTLPTVSIDFSDIYGQESAKRALEIAAAGRHNIALLGPPGTGKTMLASALTGILPPLSSAEILEVTAIHSQAGTLAPGEIMTQPPFRDPHHTISTAAMVGGGKVPRAGEITLAHRGVLFLRAVPEINIPSPYFCYFPARVHAYKSEC